MRAGRGVHASRSELATYIDSAALISLSHVLAKTLNNSEKTASLQHVTLSIEFNHLGLLQTQRIIQKDVSYH